MAVRLLIDVDNVTQVLLIYNKIKVYRATVQTGPFSEITDANTRIDIIPEKSQYYYDDLTGTSDHWYKTTYFNSSSLAETDLDESVAIQGGSQVDKIGYTFDNYSPQPGEWGKALTSDDMRYHYAWGIDMVASDELGSEVEDEQLAFCVDNAVGEFEHHFDIDIRKRIYKTQPEDTLIQGDIWREGVDYTDEEDPYDFNEQQWRNYGFVQMRHRPILSVESAEMFSPWDQKILDILDWLRLYKKSGQISFFPKGATLYGTGYAGTGIIAAWPHLFAASYPQGYKFDYTTGFKNSNFVPKDLRNAIGLLATLNALGWVGDGLLAGFSSASVSLDNLSESFSSTQSATSAYFGARIKSYIDQLKMFVKHNRLKYGNVPLGFVQGK